MVRVTSAWLRAGRAPEPAKITSSMPSPRMAWARFSPITQRSASSRFDLPQPFGPTTPVSPGCDHELGRVDEALEAEEAQAGEVQGAALLLAVPTRIPGRGGIVNSIV